MTPDNVNYLNRQLVPTQSYQNTENLIQEETWSSLGGYTLGEAVKVWLSTLKPATRQSYTYGVNALAKYNFLDLDVSLQEVAFFNHNNIIDGIKNHRPWAEATRQARAGLYIALTGFLSRRSNGLIKKAMPSKEGTSRTFYKIRHKVATPALTRSQWEECLAILSVASLRDATICRLMLQGAKRVGEVLSLMFSQVDLDNREINFIQSKSQTAKIITIAYPPYIFDDLVKLCPSKEGLVFTTKTKKQVSHKHIYSVLKRVGVQANLPFPLTPHCFRASAITYLKGSGYSSSQIQLISGHASNQMVDSYDKSSQKDNISKKITLV